MRYLMGRFAGMLQVSKKTLRHYREIGLLEPAGIDPDNGYVYYEESQRQRMLRIRYLRRLGFSLEEIGVLLSGESVDWAQVAKRRLVHVREDKRSLQGIERELVGWLPKIEAGLEVFDTMEKQHEIVIDTFALDAPILVVGRSADVAFKTQNYLPTIEALIDGFFGDDAPSQIPDRAFPVVRFGIIGEYDDATGIGIYMMGDQVTRVAEIPEGMRTFTIEPGLYARARFSAKDTDELVGQKLHEANKELYGKWMPASGFREREMISVEVYRDATFEVPTNPEMEIWAPIVPKA